MLRLVCATTTYLPPLCLLAGRSIVHIPSPEATSIQPFRHCNASSATPDSEGTVILFSGCKRAARQVNKLQCGYWNCLCRMPCETLTQFRPPPPPPRRIGIGGEVLLDEWCCVSARHSNTDCRHHSVADVDY